MSISSARTESICHYFLMAEDDPADAALFTQMLNDAFQGEYQVLCVGNFADLSESLKNGTFEALILDMNLPDQSGVENVTQVGIQYPSLPIVVLTGNEDLDLAVETLKNGAQDYLTKNNVSPEVLSRSLRYAKERKSIEDKLKIALDTAYCANRQLEIQAKYDALTGLPNRTHFHDVASRAIKQSDRKSRPFALLYIDLNHFKKINDSLGHLTGDELLVQVSNRMHTVVRESDFLARLGGDEFVIVTDQLEQKHEIAPLLDRVQKVFATPFVLGAHEISCSAAVGVSYYPEAISLDLLIKQADYAMYEAKGKNETHICFYSNSIKKQFARAQQIETLLSKGIEQQEIYGVFQPVIEFKKPEVANIEVLARWQEPSMGAIMPDEFIPIAEMTPAINSISRLLLEQMGDFYQKLINNGRTVGKFSINISPGQLSTKNFCAMFDDWVSATKIPREVICLEITERQMVENFLSCKQQFFQLQDKGYRLALDDFGSGFSSFTHLTELPFNLLKIDRKLVQDINLNTRNNALVVGIIEMAHRLNMQVVAEGVETEEELNVLKNLGCDYMQGYYFSKPMKKEQSLAYYLDK